jgi:hypothetical protein
MLFDCGQSGYRVIGGNWCPGDDGRWSTLAHGSVGTPNDRPLGGVQSRSYRLEGRKPNSGE